MIRSRASIGPVRNPHTHEAIMAAAELQLAESGYRGFTLDAVARRASASKPTLYKWWKSKAGLIAAVYTRQSAQLQPVPDLNDLHGELLFLCRDLWRLWGRTSYGEVLRSLIAEAQQEPDVRTMLRDELLPARQQSVRDVLARAAVRGELSAEGDVEAAIRMMNGFHWLLLLTDVTPDEAALVHMVSVVVRGLAAPKPSRRSKS